MITSYRTWADRLPSGWSVIPAGVAFSEPKELSRPNDLHLTPSQNYGVVTQDEYREITGHQLVRNTKSAANMKHVEPDDFIISMASHISGLERSHVAGKVSGDYRVVRPSPLYSPGFLGYLMKSRGVIEHLNLLTTEIRVGQRISYDRFSFIGLPLPPVNTQRAIADYLDRETAEIDAMSADLDDMESLLTERRSAVVTSTISRLSVKWPMPKLGTLVQMVSGSGFPHRLQGQEGKELPFYKVGSLSMTGSDGTIVDDRNSISREDAATLRARVIPDGSVLLAKIGAALLLGRFVRNAKPCCIDNNMLALIPTPEIEATFLEHALSMVDIHVLERSGPVPTLDLGGLRQHRVPLPPLEEQRRIAAQIDRETAEIDAMLADITELRDLLAERRAAVIAAAVTGQIDIPAAEETTHA